MESVSLHSYSDAYPCHEYERRDTDSIGTNYLT